MMAAARPGSANWPFTHFTTLEPSTILPVSQTPLQPFFPAFPHPRDRLDSVCPFILRGRICPSICTNVPFLSGYCPEIIGNLQDNIIWLPRPWTRQAQKRAVVPFPIAITHPQAIGQHTNCTAQTWFQLQTTLQKQPFQSHMHLAARAAFTTSIDRTTKRSADSSCAAPQCVAAIGSIKIRIITYVYL